MSISPLTKRLKPPPVPETPTLTCTPELVLRNSNAADSDIGKTVLEPSISMETYMELTPSLLDPPQADGA